MVNNFVFSCLLTSCSSGFYHDPNAGWYYSTRDGVYYKFEDGNYAPLTSNKVGLEFRLLTCASLNYVLSNFQVGD